MPNIEIDGYGALPHTQLIDRNSRIIDQLHPANDSARHSFKATNVTACSANLAEVQPHSTAELADHRKVVDAPVDSFQTVGNRIDEATGKLVIRFTRIGQRRRSHRHFQFAKQVVELTNPLKPVVLFGHRQMQGYAQVHFLYRLHRLMRMGTDEITLR